MDFSVLLGNVVTAVVTFFVNIFSSGLLDVLTSLISGPHPLV